jgi:hypothetical protein
VSLLLLLVLFGLAANNGRLPPAVSGAAAKVLLLPLVSAITIFFTILKLLPDGASVTVYVTT